MMVQQQTREKEKKESWGLGRYTQEIYEDTDLQKELKLTTKKGQNK